MVKVSIAEWRAQKNGILFLNVAVESCSGLSLQAVVPCPGTVLTSSAWTPGTALRWWMNYLPVLISSPAVLADLLHLMKTSRASLLGNKLHISEGSEHPFDKCFVAIRFCGLYSFLQIEMSRRHCAESFRLSLGSKCLMSDLLPRCGLCKGNFQGVDLRGFNP